MKPIEIAKPDNGATQMRRYCRAAVKPLHRAAYRKFHMTVQSMRRRVTKLYAGRPPSAGKSSRAVSCHAVGSKERSAEHTSELQSIMRISSAVFCLKKKN